MGKKFNQVPVSQLKFTSRMIKAMLVNCKNMIFLKTPLVSSFRVCCLSKTTIFSKSTVAMILIKAMTTEVPMTRLFSRR